MSRDSFCCYWQFISAELPNEASHPAFRNFEPWREDGVAKEAASKARLEAETGDAMKVLENKTKDSKREMDILDALGT